MAPQTLNPDLLTVPPYLGGKSVEEVQEEYGLDDVVKMASNENPLGPSPKAMEALKIAISGVNFYPGVANRDLRRKLGPLANPAFDEHNILIGNGVLDLLRMMCIAYLHNSGESIVSDVAFPLYATFTRMFGGKVVNVPMCPDYSIDLDAITDAITSNTRLIFIASPNNPSGLAITQAELKQFLERVPEHVIVLLDEAYELFMDNGTGHGDATPYIIEGRNLVIARSFSKSTGLAGMRIGYLIARSDIIQYLARTLLPFHTNTLALLAANASLDDHDFLKRSRDVIAQEREYFYQELDRLDLPYLHSQANFILIPKLPVDPKWVFEQLLRRGIILRPIGPFGVPDGLRVTINTHQNNARFIQALEETLLAAPESLPDSARSVMIDGA